MNAIRSCAVVVLLSLCACRASPPTRYYTLSDIAPGSQPSGSVPASGAVLASASARVRVERVTIPGELDRPELVRRIDPTQLQISGLDRWAAPLDEMIRRVLSADLAARLPPGMVTDIGDPRSGNPPRGLSVEVLDFYGDAGCAVTLRAAWMLGVPRVPESPARSPPLSQSPGQTQAPTPARLSEPLGATESLHVPAAGACPRGLADGMSRALAQLSDRIAAVLNRSSL